MVFNNITAQIAEPFINLHHHCDFVEINALSRGELGLDSDYLTTLYPTKDTDDLTNLFALLDARANHYDGDYPFIVDYDTKKLTLKSLLCDRKRIYIFLLLCSVNEKIVRTGNILESDFEQISTLILTKYLNNNSIIYHFGKSSYSDDRYVGKLTEKIDKLASDLKCPTTYNPKHFSVQNSGDGGLDIVAWTPFPDDDNYEQIQVYLGQCAIGKDWIGKQFDVEKMRNNIAFPHCTMNLMFIPHDIRDDDGDFQVPSIRAHLIFDRFRIMKLLNEDIVRETLECSSFSEIISQIESDEVDILG